MVTIITFRNILFPKLSSPTSFWMGPCCTSLQVFVSLHSQFRVAIFACKRCQVRLYLLFVGELVSYLRCLCSFVYSCVQHILCCAFVLFFFVLCTICCKFLWIVLFLLPLRYSLMFIPKHINVLRYHPSFYKEYVF